MDIWRGSLPHDVGWSARCNIHEAASNVCDDIWLESKCYTWIWSSFDTLMRREIFIGGAERLNGIGNRTSSMAGWNWKYLQHLLEYALYSECGFSSIIWKWQRKGGECQFWNKRGGRGIEQNSDISMTCTIVLCVVYNSQELFVSKSQNLRAQYVEAQVCMSSDEVDKAHTKCVFTTNNLSIAPLLPLMDTNHPFCRFQRIVDKMELTLVVWLLESRWLLKLGLGL